MDYSTFITEIRNIMEKRLDQPYNLSGTGTESGVKIEVPSGSKVRIVLFQDQISITTENEQGQSSFNVPSDTGLFAVDAILRVM